MPRSNKYKWQKNWNVDHDAKTATHESGVMYKLGETGVVFLIVDHYADDYADKIYKEMRPINASEHLQRIKREAIKLLKGTHARTTTSHSKRL